MEYMIRLWGAYRDKIIMLMDQGVVSGVSFLLSILLVRLIGLHVFGEFALVLIIAQGVVAINQSIITSPYQSLYSELEGFKYVKMLKSMQLLIILAISVLCFVIQLVVSFVGFYTLSYNVLPVLVYLIGVILFDFNRKQFYLERRYRVVLIKDSLVMLLQVASVFVAYFWFRLTTVNHVLWLLGSSYFVVEVLVFFYAGFLSVPTKSLLLKHWEFGKWMLGNSVLQWFSGNFYITVGVSLLGADAVGVVRIGQSIIGVWNVFIQDLENYVPPLAAKIYKEKGWVILLPIFLVWDLREVVLYC